jgi:hypothetical protein
MHINLLRKVCIIAIIGFLLMSCLQISVTINAKEAPGIIWSKTYEEGGDGYCVQQTYDGGYVILSSKTTNYGNPDIYLLKTDADGNFRWVEKHGWDGADGGRYVQQTSDGGYILTGWTRSFGGIHKRMLLIKTDSSGKQEWYKIYGGAGMYDGAFACFVHQTSDEGYIAIGVFGYEVDSQMKGGLWILKTDADGNKEWDEIFEDTYDEQSGSGYSYTSDSNEPHHFGGQTIDGGYFLSGSIYYPETQKSYIILIKTDAYGNKKWQKFYGKDEIEMNGIDSIQQTSDGGYIMTGDCGEYLRDIWLWKTDANGKKVWTKKFDKGTDELSRSVIQTNDGGFFLAGWIRSENYEDRKVWFIKTDSLGNKEWEKIHSIYDDFARYVIQNDDGDYIITGYNQGDTWLLKLKSDGIGTSLPVNDDGDLPITYETDDAFVTYFGNPSDSDISDAMFEFGINALHTGFQEWALKVLGLGGLVSLSISVPLHILVTFMPITAMPDIEIRAIYNGKYYEDLVIEPGETVFVEIYIDIPYTQPNILIENIKSIGLVEFNTMSDFTIRAFNGNGYFKGYGIYSMIPKYKFEYFDEGLYYIRADIGGYPYQSEVRIEVKETDDSLITGMDTDDTPGFELIPILFAIILALFWKRKIRK